MTRLLASVTTIDEAMVVLDSGADLIDLKNPHQGALGALPLSVISAVVRAVGGRKPVSATVGDLPMEPEILAQAVSQTAATGVDIVKIGFFGNQNHRDCIRALSPLARQIRLVGVLFADHQAASGMIDSLADCHFHGVMLDTAYKNGKKLTDHCADEELQQFVDAAHGRGLLTGLAGSLAISDIAQLVRVQPGYLGFRGGICGQSDRTGHLSSRLLDDAVRMLREYNTLSACPV